MGINFTIKDNSDLFLNALPDQVERAMEAVGLQAERHAKENLYPGHGLDTGRLRNSISHATQGNSAYIGTNVEYAPYVEMGTSRMSARPYLKPAATEHGEEYKQIVKAQLQNG